MASNLLANAAFYTSTPALETVERDRLILENLPHVRWVAMRIHEKIGGAVSLEDLVSCGVIGLINAVDSYDPKFNVKLKTYAEHRIRGAILDSIRGLDGIPVHKRKRLKDVEAAIASAEQRLQRVPSEEEIAAEMNIPLAEYQELLAELRGVSLGSLDEIADGFSESKLLRYVAHDEETLPTRILERFFIVGDVAKEFAFREAVGDFIQAAQADSAQFGQQFLVFGQRDIHLGG